MIKIIEKKVADLIPYENNARINDGAVDAVANSIKEFGIKNPIIIDKENVIVCGHTRIKACEKLGIEKVPCVVADDLTDEQIKAFRIADNSTAQIAEWDLEKLQAELENIDMDMVQFGLQEQIEEIEKEFEKEVQEDEVPEVDEENEPICKLGDIWQLGRHRLICGDSTDKATVERLMDGKKADMVFTDPPYELETQGGGILKKANSMKQIKQNGVDSFDPSKLFLYAKTNVFFHNKPLIKKYIELAEREKQPYDLAIYKKENCVPNYNSHLMTDIEYIAIIGELDPQKGYDKELYSKVYIGKKDSDNELSYSKPIDLCAKFIKLYSATTETVLDLFGGSGSTLIACEQLNRVCYMCELDPKYCDVILKRYENLTGQKATKIC